MKQIKTYYYTAERVFFRIGKIKQEMVFHPENTYNFWNSIKNDFAKCEKVTICWTISKEPLEYQTWFAENNCKDVKEMLVKVWKAITEKQAAEQEPDIIEILETEEKKAKFKKGIVHYED